jgi:hypothetical protein
MRRLSTAVLPLLFLAPAHASPQHREAEAHVHGEAQLALVSEGRTLAVEFHSPLWNLVGFEHKPANATEIEAWQAAAKAVQDPAALIRLDAAAGCSLSSKTLGAFEPGAGAAAAREDEHEDIELSYTFACADIAKLSSIEATVFRSFPKLTKVEAAYLGPSRQTARDLRPNDRVFRLR